MLNISSESRFAWAFDGSVERSCAYFDQPIKETKHFIVVPTLGSIVSGWVLIVPKLPLATFRDLPEELAGECHAIVGEMGTAIESRFGNVSVFEHGGGKGSLTACGVDQAHLHMAPLNFDLVAACEDETSIDWKRYSRSALPFDVIRTEGEYLFAAQDESTVVGRVRVPISQWFRRLIASRSGLDDKWNYRDHAFHSNIQSTIQAFQGNVD